MNRDGLVEISCKGPKERPETGQEACPTPVYWKSVEELWNGARPSGEFPGGLPGNSPSQQTPSQQTEDTRRDFLALMGFTVAAAGLAGCRAPVQNAVPFLVGSDQLVPGVSNWYATTCGGCPSACGLLVKQRDGRPIKIEGNDASSLFGGGTCATGQATVLSLYDDERLRGPQWKGRAATWSEIDDHVHASLSGARSNRRPVVLLSGTITSPATKAIIESWGKRYESFRHV